MANRRYIYGMQSGLFIKVGWSTKPKERLASFQAGNPHPMRLVMCREVGINATYIEQRTHFHLHAYAVGREWFMTDVATVKAAASQALKEARQYERAFIAWEKARRAAHEAFEEYGIPMPDCPPANPRRAEQQRLNPVRGRSQKEHPVSAAIPRPKVVYLKPAREMLKLIRES